MPRWTIDRPPPPVKATWTDEQVKCCVDAANGMLDEGGSEIDGIKACILAAGKQPCEIYSRVVGYLRPIQEWNKGRVEEYLERQTLDKKEEKDCAVCEGVNAKEAQGQGDST